MKDKDRLGFDMGEMPLIEMTANRRITVEGSTGILRYESENIKINTNKMIISFNGRGLTVRCISCSCVEIEGFVTSVEFVC
ncbi:MAG TPA: hypothetical protein DEO32_00670 [Ruminococcaceae bacterium]|nr:hypothetical protein [Oscillospiraceae bacterium]